MKPRYYIESIDPLSVDFQPPREPDDNYNVRLGYVHLTAKIRLVSSGNFNKYIGDDGNPLVNKLCADILEGKIKINP